MDKVTIIVQYQGNYYCAWIQDDLEKQGNGKTSDAAIGNLIREYQERFRVVIRNKPCEDMTGY